MKNDFYTYAFLRENGTPYYVGKGRGRRIKRDLGRCCSRPRDPSKVIFLKTGLTEAEAYRHEIYMIFVFGRKDIGTGILRNKSRGGEGRELSSSQAREMAIANVKKYSAKERSARCKRVQESMSKGDRTARQVKAYNSRLSNERGRPSDSLKKQVEVTIKGEIFIYSSAREAANELDVSRHKIQRWASQQNKCSIPDCVVRYI